MMLLMNLCIGVGGSKLAKSLCILSTWLQHIDNDYAVDNIVL